jgi:hypothetical protein
VPTGFVTFPPAASADGTNFTIPWYAAKENTRTIARIKVNVMFLSFIFLLSSLKIC